MSTDALASRLENRLKMRHYALLLAIDKHRSVTRVAEQLSLSQPTVTRALADIEQVFMAPLFVRTRRGLEPTPAGEVVLAHARFAIADNDALRRELEVVRSGRQGRLRLGMIPYASTPAIDATWQHLFSLRPRITLLVQEDTTLTLLTAVRERTLDCAICRFSHGSTDDDLEQTLLYHQQSNLVVSRPSATLLAKKKELDIGQLMDLDWIFPPSDTPVRHMIDAVFAAAGRQVPVPLLEAYAMRTVESAMRHLPRAVTILPSDIAHMVAASGAAVVLPQPLPWNPPPVGLAWLRGSPKTTIIAGLADAIRAAMPVPGA